MRSCERGFTLIEVMAAVMLLGIVYSLLAAKSTEGIWSEGDARRRLQASLLADEVLAGVETQYALGLPPDRRGSNEERGPFLIEIGLENYRPPTPPVDPAGTAAPELPQAGVPDPFGDERGLAPSVLVQIGVRVSWQDLGVDKWVERTTWVFDSAAAAGMVGTSPSLPGVPGNGSPTPPGVPAGDTPSPRDVPGGAS
jgi:prepilin-type N-terminal cleavage/methylation domain-containing protein